MNAVTLIRELHAAGICISASDDRLHVEAPAGAVTPEFRQRLAANKAKLLAHLHQSAQAVAPVVMVDRAALLTLADGLGLDRTIVHRLTTADLADCAGFPAEALRTYLLMLDATATRWAGKVPEGDTAAIFCAHCGPVFAHPDIAAVLPVVGGWPHALGCPWCFIRKAVLQVPRPKVSCSICEHFQRDLVNPEGGVGRCAVGAARPHDLPTYPGSSRCCGSWCPRKIDDE
jgi:hypothetical protein